MSGNVKNTNIEWTRYWLPWGGELPLTFGGFPVDPSEDLWKYSAQHLKTLEELDEFRCLIMLGDPGIGKSTEWKKAIECKRSSEAIFIDRDLEIHTSQDMLNRELVEPIREGSFSSDSPLYLFLDSIDTSEDNAFPFLLDRLSRIDTNGVRMRVTCRSARWNPSWTTQLQHLFGDKSTIAVELAALSRKQIELACGSFAIESDAFLDGIIKRDLVPLATRPVTLLTFLLPYYKSTGDFPKSLVELYRDGCRRLCSSEHRNMTAKGFESCDESKLVETASKIAVLSMLTGKRTLRLGLPSGDGDLLSLTMIDVETLGIAKKDAQNAVDTGLFSRVGDRIGWAHATFAEFLAAEYLKNLPMKQLRDILMSYDAKPVPQLQGLAAWIVNVMPEFGKLLLDIDPLILMLSDLPLQTPEVRRRLVDAVLDGYRKREHQIYNSEADQHAHKLKHDSIGEQLLPYVINKNEDLYVRIAAIRIAMKCKASGLGNTLVNTALDVDEEEEVRTAAIDAARECSDVVNRLRLLPVAQGQSGDDPDDELKGGALEAMWPECLTAEELFSLITDAKNETHIGTYASFVDYTLPETIRRQDIIPALNWVGRHAAGAHHELAYTYRLPSEILSAAWTFIEEDEVADAFARVVVARFEHHLLDQSYESSKKFETMLSTDTQKRRSIVRRLIPLCAENKDASDMLFMCYYPNHEPWLKTEDFDWLISLVKESWNEHEARLLANLIKGCFDWSNLSQLDRVIDICLVNPILNEEFWKVATGIALDSLEAHNAREQSRKDAERNHHFQELANRRREREAHILSLETLLHKCEVHGAGWWQYIPNTLLGKRSVSTPNFNIRGMTGWANADPETRSRTVALAVQFLRETDSVWGNWIGSNSLPLVAVAGRAALILIMREKPEVIRLLSDDEWKRWIPVLLSLYPNGIEGHESDDYEAYVELLSYARSTNPEFVEDILIRLVKRDVKLAKYIFHEERLLKCWTPRLASGLFKILKNYRTPPEAADKLLHLLITQDFSPAVSWATSILSKPVPQNANGQDRAIAIVLRLISDTETVDWPTHKKLFSKDEVFTHKLLLKLVRRFEKSDKVASRWPLTDIQDYYTWLTGKFPPANDPVHRGAYTPTDLDKAASFRNSLLPQIARRGTLESIEVLNALYQRFPDQDWIRYIIADTKERLRNATWLPMMPAEFSKLIENASNRYVRSSTQMLDIVIEVMGDIQSEIQRQEYPSVKSLWNELPFNTFRPKDEEDVSDYIARELKKRIVEKGIVVNREVQIRRRVGADKGQKPDIRIEAANHAKSADDVPPVVYVEVKGCWNKDVKTAMKSQLHDRYMVHNNVQAGLFVVANFYCKSWDDSDRRKKHSERNGDMISIENALREQAQAISVHKKTVEYFQLDIRLDRE